MKKIILLLPLTFLLFSLSACQSSNQEKEKATTVTTTTQTTSDNVDETKQAGMSLTNIEKGDYTSIIGTWQNELGDTLVFNRDGLDSENLVIQGAFLRENNLELNIVPDDNNDEAYSLILVPANTIIPDSSFISGDGDTSDGKRDRMVATKTQLEGGSHFEHSVFYKISD
ncbi:DUF6287 domain-containing protein [Streptococcus zalophi]|uniref:DUF6287 domain-containing protein n=1 Tax=Streptococcus zalophi TaxID=640031 RepID=A0A934P918_9STRE|nr:DUF6287 domain-containing protein [Streptococcus zalophi]MBJ8349197.1 hypothetical protein [Streptococcus zalophi]MCR8967180.1 DUF6287 domain-containing protein [Streptococcus zalophi]